MAKRKKKPIKARRVWVINPKTKIAQSEKAYKRQKIKKETKKLYENQREDTKA